MDDETIKDDVRREIRRLRKERGLSQAVVSERSGIDRATLSQLETGRRAPTIGTLGRLAEALECEVADFFPKVRPSLFDVPRMTAEQLGGPEGSPDPRFWGADEDRPKPATEGIPGSAGRRISVEIAEGQPGGTRVTITSESFLEVMRQVRRGELTPEQAIERITAA